MKHTIKTIATVAGATAVVTCIAALVHKCCTKSYCPRKCDRKGCDGCYDEDEYDFDVIDLDEEDI